MRKGNSISHIVTVGIDLAKNVFAVHSVNATDHTEHLMAPKFVLFTASWAAVVRREAMTRPEDLPGSTMTQAVTVESRHENFDLQR